MPANNKFSVAAYAITRTNYQGTLMAANVNNYKNNYHELRLNSFY